MFKVFKRAGMVAALAVGAMTLATTAEARDRHYRHRGGDDAALAIGAGVVGLAIGAAIASNRDRYYDRDYYYDGGYYYGRPRGYYYPRYRHYRAYPRGYYYDRRDYRRGWNRGGWDRGYRRGWGY